jgi:large repetitive protein
MRMRGFPRVILAGLLAVVLAWLANTTVAFASDNFPGTTISGASGSQSGSNIAATDEPNEYVGTFPAGSGALLNTMWYSWTAPSSGSVTFQTCDGTNTNFDTTLVAFNTASLPLTSDTPLAYNDDTPGCAITSNGGRGSRITFAVTSGVTYRIQVDGYSSIVGSFSLTWSLNAIRITKTANVSSISAPGTITYTISVANFGSTSNTAVTVTDTLLQNAAARTLTSGPTRTSGDTNSNNALDGGESWVYTATYNVTAANITTGGRFINTATVTTAQTTAITSGQAITTVNNPSLTITKTQTSPVGAITAAGALTYSIVVKNTGNVALTGVTLADSLFLGATSKTVTGPTLSSGDTNSNSALDTTETWTYTASYTVIQADMDATGNFSNTATVTTNQTSAQSSSVSTSVTRIASLAITKTQSAGPNPVTAVGNTITYQISVQNTGNQSLTTVSMADTLTLGASARTLTSGPTRTAGDTNANNILDLTETWTYSATYIVTQADFDASGSFSNTATVTTTQTGSTPSSAVATGITRNTAVAVTKTQSAGPNPVTAVGNTITYQITVKNNGNVNHSGTALADTLTLGASARTLTSGPTRTAGDTNTNNILDLTETWTYSATYTVTQADFDGSGTFSNIASFTSTQSPTAQSSSAVATNITRSPSLNISKTQSGGGNPVNAAGSLITYQISVQNTGNQTLTGVSMADALTLGASARTLTSGPTLVSGDTNVDNKINLTETWVFTATYAVTQTDIDGTGTFSNTATVTTAQTGAVASSAVVTGVTRNAAVSITKTQSAGPNPVTAVGNVITYQIAAQNAGNQTLTGVSMADALTLGASARTLTSGPTLVSGDTNADNKINLNETWVYTASYTVNQADFDATGNFSDQATFTSSQIASQSSAIVTTGVTRTPGLTLAKTWAFTIPGGDANGNGTADKDDVINYSFRALNTGNVTLTGVFVTETLFSGNNTPPVPANEALTTDAAPAGDSSDVTANNSSWSSLAPGDAVTFSANYTVNQTDIDNQ